MAGYNKQSKSYSNKTSSPAFSFSNFFKPRKSTTRIVNNARDEPVAPRKIWASDYDKGRYVAEPGIDRKAAAFIEKFHESRFTEYERPAIAAI
ncbi:hypothetical protein ACJRO7_010939 [Eucalyptus globulus]|uniref:Uncharacterized protein n=1 Tax=Eucalyptus globulus TaxID=34317 RepID=A0ABD3LH65_EUCGL